jgi:hypothetical protein
VRSAKTASGSARRSRRSISTIRGRGAPGVAPLGSGDHEINLMAAASRANKTSVPVDDRCLRAVARRHRARIRLDLTTTFPAPSSTTRCCVPMTLRRDVRGQSVIKTHRARSTATAVQINTAVTGARCAIRGRQTTAPRMKPYRGPPMTLGNAAAARVRLIGFQPRYLACCQPADPPARLLRRASYFAAQKYRA